MQTNERKYSINVILCFLVVAASMSFAALTSSASEITFNFEDINRVIPDASPFGLSDSRIVSTEHTPIESVSVLLSISGGFNGDLYAQLTHDSGFAILLNRVGRTAGNEFGYSDSGFDIELTDSALSGDLHIYRRTLFGSDTVPFGGAVTGIWAPDGRAVDPDAVVDTDPRSAFLSSFSGLDPNGTWTLFIADVSSGGESTLLNWSLKIGVVPEPGVFGLCFAALCLGFCRREFWRRGF